MLLVPPCPGRVLRWWRRDHHSIVLLAISWRWRRQMHALVWCHGWRGRGDIASSHALDLGGRGMSLSRRCRARGHWRRSPVYILLYSIRRSVLIGVGVRTRPWTCTVGRLLCSHVRGETCGLLTSVCLDSR